MAGPLCFRLPADLHAAVEDLAQQAGISTSEWVRDVLFRIVYGEPPGIDQGYMTGRQLGFRMMQLAFKDAWDMTPMTAEEATERLGVGNPGKGSGG
jgi:hypothetical protein